MNFILTLYFLFFTPLLTAGGIGIFLFFVIEVLYFNIGLIYLLKAKILGYRSFYLNFLVQSILYNFIMLMSFYIVQVIAFVLLFLLLNIFNIYLNIKIIKNRQILKQYLSSKNHKCQKCGTRIKKNWENCPKCGAFLVERKNSIEEVPIQNVVQRLRSDKIPPEPDKIVGKRSELKVIIGNKPEAGENMERFDLELFKDLSILKEEEDKKLLKKYLLERFVVVSKHIRNEIDKLNLSREEKIDLLKDLAFLTSKEQQNLLELLVKSYNI